MTIAQLIFDLDRVEDADSYRLATEAADWFAFVLEYDNWLRNAIKHGGGNDDDGEKIDADRARTKLYELLQERRLLLHDRG